jgi:hypothetical protein
MKNAATLVIFATVLGTIYGVLFSLYYPLVKIDAGIVLLCAFLGLISAMIAIWIWKLIARK